MMRNAKLNAHWSQFCADEIATKGFVNTPRAMWELAFSKTEAGMAALATPNSPAADKRTDTAYNKIVHMQEQYYAECVLSHERGLPLSEECRCLLLNRGVLGVPEFVRNIEPDVLASLNKQIATFQRRLEDVKKARTGVGEDDHE